MSLLLLFMSPAGSSSISGSLNQTLADLTLNAAGTVSTNGLLNGTLGNLVLSGSGMVSASGALNQLLAPLTLSAAGTLGIFGTLSETLEALVVNASGAIAINAELAQTLAALSLVAAGDINGGTLVPTARYVSVISGGQGSPLAQNFMSVLPNQLQTLSFDFGRYLPGGCELIGTPEITLSVAPIPTNGTDTTPQDRLIRGPQISTVPTSEGGTGVTNAGILFQVSGFVPGVIYQIEASCSRSDGPDTVDVICRIYCSLPI